MLWARDKLEIDLKLKSKINWSMDAGTYIVDIKIHLRPKFMDRAVP